MTDPRSGGNPRRVGLPTTRDLAIAVEEARALLERRLADLDPDLLVELTVGLRTPPTAEAGWTDSWTDRFLDNGKFSDMWINLTGDRERYRLAEDERFGGAARRNA